jgi:branched-chain amino acid transport system permease protein
MKNRIASILLATLVLAVLVCIPLVSGRFTVYLAMRVMLLGIFAVGYNLLLGQTGLLSFGHGAFYAAGAYGMGFFWLHLSPHPLLGIAAGILAAALLALLIGFFCVRHTEIYFAMLTLAFGMMVFSLIWNVRGITGGDDGLVGIMRDPIPFFGLAKIPTRGYGTTTSFFHFSSWVCRPPDPDFPVRARARRDPGKRAENGTCRCFR